MAEYFVNNLIGSDAGAGTEEDPWFTVPGMTGGNAVIAGDIINVRNGTTNSGSRLILPANNLTYRGYGMASNVLVLEIPRWWAPWVLRQVKVVREAGVHEGMWVVDGTGQTSQGILNFSTRTGCVIEDICITNSLESSAAVSIGTSTQANVGATMRRFAVLGGKQGMAIYRPDTLLEDGIVRDTLDDGIVIGTGLTQSYHAGRFNTLRRLNLIDNGVDETTGIGDPVQLLNSDGYQGTLKFQQSMVRRNSPVKQGFMMAAVAGSVEVEAVHWDGEVSGSVQVGIESVQAGGKVTVRRNYWRQVASNGNPYVRLVDGSNPFADGGLIVVEDNVVDAQSHAGLFSLGPFLQTIAGDVIVRNNTVLGVADNGLSWSAAIGAQTAGTLAATCSMTIENNLIAGASPVAIRLPTGGQNNARWVARGNRVHGTQAVAYFGAAGFGQEYGTVAAFQAAHSFASGNSEGDPLTTPEGIPLPGSPLLTQGIDLGYLRDIRGFQSRKHIGAYGPARLRIV